MRYVLLFMTMLVPISVAFGNEKSEESYPIDFTAYEKKYAEFDAVYLHYGTQIQQSYYPRVTQVNPFFCNTIVDKSFLVLNPEAAEFTNFSIFLRKNEDLTVASFSVLNRDGAMISLSLKDTTLQENGDGSKKIKLAFPDIKKGSIVTVRYKIHYDQNLDRYFEIPLQFTVPCESRVFKYVYPKKWKVQIKKLGVNKILPVMQDEIKGVKIITYEKKDVPAVCIEPYSPSFREMSHYLEARISYIKMYRFELKKPRHWEDLSKEYRQYVVNRDTIFSQKISSTVKRVVLNEPDNLKKIRRVMNYIQNEFNQNKDWKDVKFEDIIKAKSGDPYSITGLTMAMLRSVGIPCEFLLVHSSEDGYLDPDFISPLQYSMPALKVGSQEPAMILFPYMVDIPVGHVPIDLEGQPALVIPKRGKVYTMNLPPGGFDKNKSKEEINIQIQEDGTVTVEQTLTFYGSFAYYLRKEFNQTTDKGKSVRELIGESFTDPLNVEFKINNLTNLNEPLSVHVQYQLTDLLTLVSDEAIFNTENLFSAMSYSQPNFDMRDRKMPIRLPYNETIEKRFLISFPVSWQLETLFHDTEFENQFGKILFKTILTPEIIDISQVFQLHSGNYSAKEAVNLQELNTYHTNKFDSSILFSFPELKAEQGTISGEIDN